MNTTEKFIPELPTTSIPIVFTKNRITSNIHKELGAEITPRARSLDEYPSNSHILIMTGITKRVGRCFQIRTTNGGRSSSYSSTGWICGTKSSVTVFSDGSIYFNNSTIDSINDFEELSKVVKYAHLILKYVEE